MATKKVEVNEDDLKKAILILKCSKQYVQLPPADLFLGNLWRVAEKLGDKLMRKADLVIVEGKGHPTLKHPDEIKVTEESTKEEVPVTTENPVAETPAKEEPQQSPTDEQPAVVTEEQPKVEEPLHRCRKRQKKAK